MSQKNKQKSLSMRKNNKGAALIVVLVMLAAITVVGVSNMRSATSEMRMITSTIDRNEAFAIAEAGLTAAEAQLETNINSLDDLYTDTCNPDSCFNSNCNNGYCFEGTFNTAEVSNLFECKVATNAGSTERKVFWQDENVWSRSRQVTVGTREVQYIVEFLCFVDNSGNFGDIVPDSLNDGDPFFRITAFLEGDGGRAPVMLQSNYVVKI